MKINEVICFESHEQLVQKYHQFVSEIRVASTNGKINEYFANFGFKPRFLEIIDICFLYPDGEILIHSMYDYVIKEITPNKIAPLIESLSKYDSFIPLLIRDFDYLYNKLIHSDNNQSRLEQFAVNVGNLPNGNDLITPKMDELILSTYQDPDINKKNLEMATILKDLREKLSIEKQFHPVIPAIIKSRRSHQIKQLLERLLTREQVNDFESIGEKTWSNLVFKIGSKVLKIGYIRNNPICEEHYRVHNPEYFEIMYHTPVSFESFESGNEEKATPLIYLEVFDYLSNENVSEKDIEDFYYDLDQDDLTYVDPRGKDISNFGLLTNTEEVSRKHKNLSLTFKRKPVVLTDRDCVWKKNHPNIQYFGPAD